MKRFNFDKYAVLAAALTVSGAVSAAPAKVITKPTQKKVAPKSTIAKTSLRTRPNKLVTAGTGMGATTASASTSEPNLERTSQAPQSDSMSAQSSSATRMALPATATSTVEANKVPPGMIPIENFKFSSVFSYYGSSLATPFDSRVPDFYHGYQDSESEGVSAELYFSFGYKFHPNYTLSLNPGFGMKPNQNGGTGSLMKPQASYVKLGVGQFAKVKNMKWNGDFRVYPGATDDLRGTPIYLRTGQNLSFTLSKNTTFAIYNTFRYYVRTNTKLEKGWANYDANPQNAQPPFTFRMTSSPSLEYQASDAVGLAISYNIDERLAEGSSITDFNAYNHEADGPYVEAGLSLDFIKNLNLNPYVDTYTRRPNFYGTRIGVNLAWTIL